MNRTAPEHEPAAGPFDVVAGVVGLTVLAACLWALLWATVVPLVLGWHSVVLTSGSMGPALHTGDVVLAAPVDDADGARPLGVGAVIVFEAGPDRLVTHRIVDRTPDGDYVTKGDANERIDSSPVTPSQVLGTARAIVPYVGRPSVWAGDGRFVELTLLSAVLGASGWAVARLARRSTPAPRRRRATATAADRAVEDVLRPTPLRFAATSALVLGLFLAISVTSVAAFSAATTSSGSLAADTLDPPTGVTATPALGTSVDIDWTASTDAYADGYRILRSETSGGDYSLVGTVAGRTTTSFSDDPCGGSCDPNFRAAGAPAIANSATNSLTIPLPTGVAEGDLLIAHLAIDDNAPTFTPPPGWSQLLAADSGGLTPVTSATFHRIAGASEPATATFSWSGSAETGVGGIVAYDNVAPSWLGAGAYSWGAGSTATAPDVTSPVNGTIVVRLLASEDVNLGGGTVPAGHTSRFEAATSTFGDVTAMIVDAPQGSGPTGNADFDLFLVDDWVATTLVLNPVTFHYVVETTGGPWTSVASDEAS